MGRNSHDGVLGTFLPKVRYLTREAFEMLGPAVSFDMMPEWSAER